MGGLNARPDPHQRARPAEKPFIRREGGHKPRPPGCQARGAKAPAGQTEPGSGKGHRRKRSIKKKERFHWA